MSLFSKVDGQNPPSLQARFRRFCTGFNASLTSQTPPLAHGGEDILGGAPSTPPRAWELVVRPFKALGYEFGVTRPCPAPVGVYQPPAGLVQIVCDELYKNEKSAESNPARSAAVHHNRR